MSRFYARTLTDISKIQLTTAYAATLHWNTIVHIIV